MSDLIRRQDAIDALKKIMFTHLFENGEYIGEDTREVSIMSAKKALDAIENLSSAEPERKKGIENAHSLEGVTGVIRCENCKWWDRLEDGHPYGDCRACRSGTHTERWNIHIQRQCKFDFYCADAEPKEDECSQ